MNKEVFARFSDEDETYFNNPKKWILSDRINFDKIRALIEIKTENKIVSGHKFKKLNGNRNLFCHLLRVNSEKYLKYCYKFGPIWHCEICNHTFPNKISKKNMQPHFKNNHNNYVYCLEPQVGDKYLLVSAKSELP